MKTVRWARNSDLPGTQLIRYSMSLKGVACAIVGLDSLAHLEENAAMTHNFEPMDTDMMGQMSDFVREELAAIAPAPWTRPGYDDCVSS
jgi:aryl-alcohol dehydrogenase-like predicted oxidoreductase